MLTAKIILILSFIYRMINHIRKDEKYTEKGDRIGARLATATIFIVTALLYYFAGIFNLDAGC